MLKSYIGKTIANELVTLCGTRKDKDLTIMSLLINGGEEGGDFTLSIGDYQEKYSIDAENTVAFDHKIMLGPEQSLTVLGQIDGVTFCVSAIESTTNEDL